MEQSRRRLVLGLFLVVIGTLFLLRNLDIIDLPWYFYTWQMLLIAIGAFNFLTGNRSAGFIITGIGLVFLLPKIADFDLKDFWPVILIIIGFSFFLRNRTKGSYLGSENRLDVIDEMAFLGGGEKIFTSQALQGGKVSATFGGLDLDLRKCQLASGPQVLDVSVFAGGIDLKVPESWVVKSEITPIAGGYSDKRAQSPVNNERLLILKGSIIFGGVEVSS